MPQIPISREIVHNYIVSNFLVNGPPINVVEEGIYESVHGGVLLMQKTFRGKYWNALDLSNIEEEELMFAFSFFTSEARQYYFPGLMLTFLYQDMRKKQSNLACSFIDGLNFEYHYYEGFGDYLLSLNRKQENAVAFFLQHIVNENSYGALEAKEALEHYWDMYLLAVPEYQ
jgi:hypothetical protein